MALCPPVQVKYQNIIPKLTPLTISTLVEQCDPRFSIEDAESLLLSDAISPELAQAIKLELIKRNQPIL